MNEVTRRDFLAGTLGLLALTGCPVRSRATSRKIEGEIKGQDAARGHLLRSGELLSKRIDETIDVPVLVVGAGVSGLSCAWRLRREGVPRDDVLVLELASAPGGNAASGKNDVSPYPWGAHYLRAPTAESRGLTAFLEEIGVVRGRDSKGRLDFDTRFVCSEPVERIFEGGVWSEGIFPPPRSGSAEDRAELSRFRRELCALSRRRDEKRRRPFAIPVDRSARTDDLLALDRISFDDWLSSPERGKPFASRALLWLLEYGCRDDYGATLATTSAWAGLHYHLARGLEDDDLPDDERDHGTTLVWPEGNGWLVSKLVSARGGTRLETDRIVYRLEPDEKGGAAALAWDPVRSRAVRYRARHVVFAGARFLLSHLLEEPPEGLAEFEYAPWLAANVTLDRAPAGVGAPLSWDNVLYESPSLGYVVATRGTRAEEPQVITWYHAFVEGSTLEARRRLHSMSYEEARDMCLADFERAHPRIAESVRRVDVWKWGHAMIRPRPGFLWGKAREAAQAPIGNLLTANSDKGGIPIFEEAFFQGALAGEEILAREGKAFVSLL
ncbi:FAD-dependent oxidoreductase [bacterium]|nr:FAD-dependent oxidoreductase [bacterium]